MITYLHSLPKDRPQNMKKNTEKEAYEEFLKKYNLWVAARIPEHVAPDEGVDNHWVAARFRAWEAYVEARNHYLRIVGVLK